MTDTSADTGSGAPSAPPPDPPDGFRNGGLYLTVHPARPQMAGPLGAPQPGEISAQAALGVVPPASGPQPGEISADEALGTPAPAPPSGAAPQTVGDLRNGTMDRIQAAAARGLTLGLSDKMQAVNDAAWASPFVRQWANTLSNHVGLPQPFDIDPNAPSFSDAYHASLDQERQQSDAFAAAHPAAAAGAYAGGMLPTLMAAPIARAVGTAPLAIEAAGSALSRIGSAAQAGAAAGAAGGFASTNDQSLMGDVAATGEGAAAGGAFGGAIGVTAPYIQKVLGPIGNWFAARFGAPGASGAGAPSASDAATKIIMNRMRQDAAAGGPTAQDMLDLMVAGGGKPLTLMDTGGANLRGEAGAIARTPGPGKEGIESFLNDRDAAAGSRLNDDTETALGSGSAYSTSDALIQARDAAARPLYHEAFAGGSTAPLETQLRKSLQQATSAKALIAKQIAKIEREKSGALAARGSAGAETRARYADLQKDLAQAESDRQATLGMFQKAKTDASTSAPGAIWSPRIQEFLDDPIIKRGIARGIKIQRLEALAKGQKFNPTEYAITGTDAKGDPIVSRVPNTRLLDAAKRGLDAIIQKDRNPLTNRLSEYGRAVDMVRRSLLTEIDAANPTYAKARAAFSGPTQSKEAVEWGRRALGPTRSPERNQAEFNKLSPGDQQFAKLGLSDAIREKIAKVGPHGNEALAIGKTKWARDQVRPFFADQASYDRFMGAIQAEHRMFETRQHVLGNSATAARQNEDANGEEGPMGDIVRSAVALFEGGKIAAAMSGAKAIGTLLKRSRDPEVAAAAARMLTETNPATVRGMLQRVAELSRRPDALKGVAFAGGGQAGRAAPPLIGTR